MLFRKKHKIIQLWEEVFGDKNEFIGLFFKRVYKDNNAFVIEEAGKILSTLQLVTYKMNYYGEEISMAYIVGACTRESCRNNGLMGRLMVNVLEEIKSRRMALTALIPANKELFEYYSKFGFTKAFEYSLHLYIRNEDYSPDDSYIFRTIDNCHDIALQDFFIRKLKERRISVLHYGYDMETIIQDIKLSPGNIFAVLDREHLTYQGLAFTTVINPNQPKDISALLIKEIVYEDEKAKEAILHHATGCFNLKQAVYRLPCTDDLQPFSYGMARVIDTERMVNLWLSAHPRSRYTKEELMAMDVQALTPILLDYPNRTAYMSLMLD